MKLYAVVDKKAKDIVAVFPSNCDEAASRSFVSLLSGAQSIYTDYPEDFALYAIAELEVAGYNINVFKPGNESLRDHGFKCDSFQVIEPLTDGSELSKAYLAQLHAERMSYYAIVPGTEPNGAIYAEVSDNA